jgi:mono/diheme cytochrome c family protein
MRSSNSLVALLVGLLFAAAAAPTLQAQDNGDPTPAATLTPGEGMRLHQLTPAAGDAEAVSPLATPTIDRLAPPPTVEHPDQADEGAQLFWLHCQPCHGDQGQGLTDEWRAQYPPEDQNCWESGCHGGRPYENGFTLPETVPAVIGGDSLRKFDHLGQVYGYIRAAMPYQAPGYLSEEEYLAITAFLGRSHGVSAGTPLTAEAASERPFLWAPPPETPTAAAASGVQGESSRPTTLRPAFVAAAAGVAALLIGGLWIWRRRL